MEIIIEPITEGPIHINRFGKKVIFTTKNAVTAEI
jgi:hypothetical protein